jgi:hypothetical protein
MVRLHRPLRPNGTTLLGGLAMSAGALVYLNDQVAKPRNWHVFLWPALALIALGTLIAIVGAVWSEG